MTQIYLGQIVVVDSHRGLVKDMLEQSRMVHPNQVSSAESLQGLEQAVHDLRGNGHRSAYILLVGPRITDLSIPDQRIARNISTARLIDSTLRDGNLVGLMSYKTKAELPEDIQALIGPGQANYVPKSTLGDPDEFYDSAVIGTLANHFAQFYVPEQEQERDSEQEFAPVEADAAGM